MDFNKTSEVVNSTFNWVYFREFFFPILVLVLLVLIIVLLIVLIFKMNQSIVRNDNKLNLTENNNIGNDDYSQIILIILGIIGFFALTYYFLSFLK